MKEEKRTTKRVTGTFAMTFYGDGVPVDLIRSRVDAWTDNGLNDREDLQSWDFEVTEIEEIDGDPEGYDV